MGIDGYILYQAVQKKHAYAYKFIPEPQQYKEQWPFGLYLGVLGHYSTYFCGLGRGVEIKV